MKLFVTQKGPWGLSSRAVPESCSRVRPFRLKNFFAYKRIKQIWIRYTCVLLFHYKISLLFFAFFRFFSLKIFASLWFSNFASKRNKAKQNSSIFFCFFLFFLLYFSFFCFFLLNFRFTSIFLLILPLFSLQIFVVSHRSESCEIRFFSASKRNEIFALISNFASEAKVRAHPNPAVVLPIPDPLSTYIHICSLQYK